jgi:pyruvate dehydrogenase phosphatase
MFLNANPPLVTRAAKVEEWVPRILTPPYITNRAAIQHRKLEPGTEAVLVLSSDGMTDLLAPTSMMLTPQLINDLAQQIGKFKGNGEPLSQQLLQYAMGGDDIKKASQYITVDMDGSAWMDDTTVVCLPL